MKKVSAIVFALIVLMTSGQAFCEEKKGKAGWGAETMVASYQIGIGDILEITTWKEPDFTRPN